MTVSDLSRAGARLLPLLLTLSWPAQALAQTQSLASQERAVTGGDLMLAAYVIFWLLIFGFLAYVLRAQRALSRDMDALQARVARELDAPLAQERERA